MVRVLGIGDNTVDIYVDQGVQFPGGNAVNIAVMMKRIGADTAYLGCVGSDRLGGLIRSALEDEGVDISRLRRSRHPNAWSRIRHEGTDRIFDGNNAALRDSYQLSEDDFAWMGGFDLAHSSIYSGLDNELAYIRAAGPLMSFDYSSEYDDAYIARTAPHLDIAFLSAPGRTLSSCTELARTVAAYGPRVVVITRGAEGAVALENDKALTQQVVPTEVVDTLGAGDGFIAGFCMTRLTGGSLAEQMAAGAAYAARICRIRGAFGHGRSIWPGQPGLEKPRPHSGR
ncbi:PfkB family carbohydrate kinase [Arhodomonas sp. AD133]|uniref:PfkB family carbohydrate kinase n=1 Tax=Arhodomonas sp. AD133 TaxID=3415009 RepID=UPI003EBBA509